jgi:N-acetylglucosaminyl-diphospho-decaprenol L-rhamnosyltransferase
MTSSVEVVIVNWNTGDCLRACLASVAAGRGDVLRRLTIVDNGSADDSAAGLDTTALPLQVLRNRDNRGFAAGCNQGAAGATATYILFLNPDTRVFADTLDRMVRFMDSPAASGIGICGAQIVDHEGRPRISCARFPTLRILFGKMTRLDRLLPRVFPRHHLTPAETAESRVVDQVIGAAFLVRRDLFERLSGFDERYFLYFEEVDFALRAHALGAESYFLKDARVFHTEGRSSSNRPDLRLYHSLRSRLLFANRHWPRWQGNALVALTLMIELPARLVRGCVHADSRDVAATLAGSRRLIRELPILMRAPRTGRAVRPSTRA